MAEARRETGGLIGSDKVDGTAVYGTDREKAPSDIVRYVMDMKLPTRRSRFLLRKGRLE